MQHAYLSDGDESGGQLSDAMRTTEGRHSRTQRTTADSGRTSRAKRTTASRFTSHFDVSCWPNRTEPNRPNRSTPGCH
ncbi:unnamed protein product [Soboliphyme baturini]|uniref:Transposase n=1 Tax=Soboliphyme baturini TaxID=241478 RepID=A0A183J450_9BILA|nr:unnamed protein product [Soboliphyme baturini]